MTLKKQLIVGLIGTMFVVVMMIGTIFLLFNSVHTLQQTLLEKGKIETLETSLASENDYLSSQMRLYIMTGDKQFDEKYTTALNRNLFSKVADQLKTMDVPPHITKQLENIQIMSDTMAQTEVKAGELYREGKKRDAQVLIFTDSYEQGIKKVDDMFDTFKSDIETWTLQRAEKAERTAGISIIIIGASIVLYLLFTLTTLMTLRNRVKPLFAMTKQAEKIAKGDLTVQKIHFNDKSKDEITSLARSFNTMTSSLRQVITTVTETSKEVEAASHELFANAAQTNETSAQVAQSVDHISKQATVQQTNIQENCQSISEVSEHIAQVAEVSENVSTISADATHYAENGQTDLYKTVSQMKEIENAVNDMYHFVQSLEHRTTTIETYIDAIHNIADQTNLLALNAAIEAARAGESGKGFAVVAEEVKKLAEQSSKSAAEIVAIIQALHQDMHKTAQQMKKVTTTVHEGVEVVTLTKENFNKIHHATQLVSANIQKVANATQKMTDRTRSMTTQSHVIEETASTSATKALSSVRLVHEQYASVEAITQAADQLLTLSHTLSTKVSTFKI